MTFLSTPASITPPHSNSERERPGRARLCQSHLKAQWQSKDSGPSIQSLTRVDHLPKDPGSWLPAPCSAHSSRYLGPKAKLVDSVLSLRVLGKELVIVLL